MRRKKTAVVSVPVVPVQSTPEPLTVTIPQAAQMLNCTVRAVRELLWAKKIPFLKIGKRFVIPISDLRSFVQRVAA